VTYDEAEKLALKAIHDDGRGMIGRNRNHLHQRVARALLAAHRGAADEIDKEPVAWLTNVHKGAGEKCFIPAAKGDPNAFPVFAVTGYSNA